MNRPHPAGLERLVAVDLDGESIERGSPEQETERRIAVQDLIENSVFGLPDRHAGPYRLTVGFQDTKLVLDIRNRANQPVVAHILSLAPFRSMVKDYGLLCDSYNAALRTASPAQIEAIDMGRRGLHNEAAELLARRLNGKVVTDFETMRRLFTLLMALHWKR